MTTSAFRAAMAGAMIIGAASTAGAVGPAQPLIGTPANPPVLPNVLYQVVYAASGRFQEQNGAGIAETIVTVGNPPTNPACQVQLQWLNFAGVTIGFSGPFVIGPDQTYEFTTVRDPAFRIPPYEQNVFRNTDNAFEGFAKVRSTCPVNIEFRVDAGFVLVKPPTAAAADLPVYREINVVRRGGNVGD